MCPLDTEEQFLSKPVVTHTVSVPGDTTEPTPLGSAARAAHVHASTFRGTQQHTWVSKACASVTPVFTSCVRLWCHAVTVPLNRNRTTRALFGGLLYQEQRCLIPPPSLRRPLSHHKTLRRKCHRLTSSSSPSSSSSWSACESPVTCHLWAEPASPHTPPRGILPCSPCRRRSHSPAVGHTPPSCYLQVAVVLPHSPVMDTSGLQWSADTPPLRTAGTVHTEIDTRVEKWNLGECTAHWGLNCGMKWNHLFLSQNPEMMQLLDQWVFTANWR